MCHLDKKLLSYFRKLGLGLYIFATSALLDPITSQAIQYTNHTPRRLGGVVVSVLATGPKGREAKYF
jgi:hypothetical protein